MDYFTTSQVARELKVSDQTIRNLCLSGKIQHSRTDGGHYRILPAVLDQLKQEGLPLVPHTMAGNGARPAAKGTQGPLLAPPGEDAVQSAEDAFISDRELSRDTNRLQQLRVHKESVELRDFFADREQRRLQQALDDERMEAELVAKQRRERQAELDREQRDSFFERWFLYALDSKPRNGPGDYALLIQPEMLAAMSAIRPGMNDVAVRSLIDAAIARALQPWYAAEKKCQAKSRAVSQALELLPLQMRWDDEWAARAKEAAFNAVDGAREGATASELAAIAGAAVRPLLPEFQHHEKIVAEQLQSTKDKEVLFVRDVLDDPERAAEIEDEDLEDYASRRKISLTNSGRNTKMANGGNSRTKQDLLDEIADLKQENQDLQEALDSIADIATPPPEEEDDGDVDDDSDDYDDSAA